MKIFIIGLIIIAVLIYSHRFINLHADSNATLEETDTGETIYVVKKKMFGKTNIKKYDDKGHLIYYEKYNGYWKKYRYDVCGNEVFFENSNSYWIKSEYNEKNQIIHSENSKGFWRFYMYDKYGNVRTIEGKKSI